MPITERLMSLGDWSIQLDRSVPARVRDRLAFHGHVIVTPQRVDHNRLSAASILNLARFTGVVLDRVNRRSLSGTGLAMWMGLENNVGDVLTTAVTKTAGTFQQWMTDLVPVTLTNGSLVGSAPAGTLNYSAYLVTRRSAIDYVCAAFDAEWRVKANGTVDYGVAESLFRSTPQVIVMPGSQGRSGLPRGLEVANLTANEDVERFSDQVYVIAQGEGPSTAIGHDAVIYVPSPPPRGVTGAFAYQTLVVSSPGTTTAQAGQLSTALLEQHRGERRGVQLSVRAFDVGRDVVPGDWIWVYDPENGLTDTANKVVYRGGQVSPVKLRALAFTWPVESGMGVYYRDRDGKITDLTDWVVWETGTDTQIEVGASALSLSDEPPTLGGPVDIVGRISGGPPWTSYTPTFAHGGVAVNLQNGTAVASYVEDSSRRVHVNFEFQVGSSTTFPGTGDLTISLPFPAKATVVAPEIAVGSAVLRDASPANAYPLKVTYDTVTRARFLRDAVDGNTVTHNSPIAFAAGDTVAGFLIYERA